MERLKNQLGLSAVSLGTMRFHDKSLTTNQVVRLIENSYDIGITTHHSSFEYSSYELYTKALKSVRHRTDIKHIVKLSSPHFEDDGFSTEILVERVENQLRALNIEQIDVLQWLVRSKPINDKDRLAILENQKIEIKACLSKLKQQGKVKSIFSFPYSPVFAKAATKLEEVDGIISYLNSEELEYTHYAKEFPFIAIRPFFAGKLIQGDGINRDKKIRKCLDFVRGHDAVLTQIVGINSLKQLDVFSAYND
ncbi:aldo/keto reductase [Croceitalea rosinachiae]|uniref:Aldo/keto reductase n=1 Tax=Croceitalea rosinachiae TaxID=3075596 RepID=A0ABU3ACE0_9FLAO|nr:aldo/keto reductase [Croceitalea sp. F388]MDT0607841.1 aldo/keto reductase [Croceitalea sp. F388]